MCAVWLVALGQFCVIERLDAAAPGERRPASLLPGPTLRLDCARGPSPENAVSDFMYFIPLISPVPVVSTSSPATNHYVRVLSAVRRDDGDRFQVNCEFELSGKGYDRNLFDYKNEAKRREAKLKRDGVLLHVLSEINIQGPGRGTIEIEGTLTNGEQTVAEVRLRFNSHRQTSPVTIALADIRRRDGILERENELVARVNTLTFQRKPGPPKMEVSVASLKSKDAGDSTWQNLKGAIKGFAVNLLIPPIEVDPRGHQAMLDFGQALSARAPTFTFPRAANLLAGGQTGH